MIDSRGRSRPLLGVLLPILVLIVGEALAAEPAADITRYDHHDGLPQSALVALAETPDRFLWIGSRDGLIRFDGTRFELHDSATDPAFRNPHVRSLAVGPDGTLWAGTDGGGLVRRVGQGFEEVMPEVLGSERILALAADGGGLFIGSFDRGVAHYDGQRVRRMVDFSESMITALDSSSTGRAWAGTFGEGVFAVAAEGLEIVLRPDPLPDQRVLALLATADGGVWVGTVTGRLFHIDGAGGHREFEVPGSVHDRELPRSRIHSLARDGRGRLFIGTRSGLACLEARDRLGECAIRHRGTGRVEALLVDHGGQLWAAMGELVRLGLEPVRSWEIPSPRIEGIWADGVEVGLVGDTAIVPAGSRQLEIRFTAPHLVPDPSLEVMHRLEGFDDWQPSGDRRRQVYDNLPPDTYVFEARARAGVADASGADASGADASAIDTRRPSEEKTARLEVKVLPSFFESWLFLVLVLLLVVTTVVLAHRWQARHLEARRRRLENRIEKTLDELEILHGLMPICGTCHKIRDDDGYWAEVEEVIEKHTDAVLSHGICPECTVEILGEASS